MIHQETSGKWILLGGLMIAFLAFGLGLKSDQLRWLNSSVGEAEAGQIRTNTEIQQEKARLDLALYEAEIQASIEQLKRDAVYEATQKEGRTRLTETLILLAAGTVSASVLLLVGAATLKAVLPASVPKDPGPPGPPSPWDMQEYRRRVKEEARRNEILTRRTAALAGNPAPALAQGTNGHSKHMP
jgi:hypothetical protein